MHSGCGRTAKVGLWLVGLAIVGLTLGLTFPGGDRWTALLGGLARRQGWITEITEFVVLIAAMAAARTGILSLRTIVRYSLVAAAAVSASAICQSHWVHFLDPTRWSHEVFNRVAGTLGTPSQLETYIAIAIPLTLGFGFDATRRRESGSAIAAAAILVLEIVALVFARGRSGTMGAIVGIFVIIALYPAASTRVRALRNAIYFILLASCIFVAGLNIKGSPLRALAEGNGPFQHLFERLAQITNFESGGGRVRALLADATEKSLASRPAAWIVGFGPDLAWDALAPFDSPEREAIEGFGTAQDRPHQFVAEKLMAGGLPYAIAWVGILCLAAVVAIARVGLVRNPARMAVATIASSAIAFLATATIGGKPGFAPAAAALAPAALLLAWAFVASLTGHANTKSPSRANSGDGILMISVFAAFVSHMVAGSFGVSMAPERTLVWALAGFLFGGFDGERRAQSNSWDSVAGSAKFSGAILGTALCAVLPFYAYHVFRWESLQPVYAAAIVPITILGFGAVLTRQPRLAYIREFASVTFVGIGILGACVWRTGQPGDPPQEHHGPMSLFTPLIILWIVIVFVFVGIQSRVSQQSPIVGDSRDRWSDVRPIAAAFLLCLTVTYAWVSGEELRSDTTMFAAIQLNERAGALEMSAKAMARERSEEKQRALDDAVRINGIALRLVKEAKAIGAPLGLLGCPSPHERVIEKERP